MSSLSKDFLVSNFRYSRDLVGIAKLTDSIDAQTQEICKMGFVKVPRYIIFIFFPAASLQLCQFEDNLLELVDASQSGVPQGR